MMAGRISRSMVCLLRPECKAATTRSIGLDADKGNDDAAEAVDQQVTAQQRAGADGAIGDAFQRQRDQRDDEQAR